MLIDASWRLGPFAFQVVHVYVHHCDAHTNVCMCFNHVAFFCNRPESLCVRIVRFRGVYCVSSETQ